MLSFLNHLFNQQCIICNITIDDNLWCEKCSKNFIFIQDSCEKCGRFLEKTTLCKTCLENNFYFDQAFSIFTYNTSAKKLIHNYKFKNKRFYFHAIADLIMQRTSMLNLNIDYLMPIPIHYFRLLQRGYNQSALIARNLALKMNKYFAPNILRKSRYHKPQHQIEDLQTRVNNLQNSFKIIKNDNFFNKNILLVDDVLTTATTVNECAKILKNELKVAKVFIITLASTLPLN